VDVPDTKKEKYVWRVNHVNEDRNSDDTDEFSCIRVVADSVEEKAAWMEAINRQIALNRKIKPGKRKDKGQKKKRQAEEGDQAEKEREQSNDDTKGKEKEKNNDEKGKAGKGSARGRTKMEKKNKILKESV